MCERASSVSSLAPRLLGERRHYDLRRLLRLVEDAGEAIEAPRIE